MQTCSTTHRLGCLRPEQQQRRAARRPAFGKAMKPAIHRSAAPSAAADDDASSSASRRGVLLSLTGAALLARAPAGFAEEEASELKTFYGMATPPTSYGGYGGNDPNAQPKYSFVAPATWKPDTINKTDKGTQGIDSRVYNPKNRSKKEQVFVITLTRAGEDAAQFALRDIDSTLAGFAGADYDMQDALSYATENTSQKREVNGQQFYDIKILSPDVAYLSTITVSGGKVFAMFVKAPIKNYLADEAMYRSIIDSFTLL